MKSEENREAKKTAKVVVMALIVKITKVLVRLNGLFKKKDKTISGSPFSKESVLIAFVLFIISVTYVISQKAHTFEFQWWWLLVPLALGLLRYSMFSSKGFPVIKKGFWGKLLLTLLLLSVIGFLLWLFWPIQKEDLPLESGKIHLAKGVRYEYYRDDILRFDILAKEKTDAILTFQKEEDSDIFWKQRFINPRSVDIYKINDDETLGYYFVVSNQDLDAEMIIIAK